MKSVCKIPESEWETQVLHLPALEEARARAVQMEKTIRWWSECTANWREKWSKVRYERNIAREEVKLLQTKLDCALKGNNTYQRQKQNLKIHNERMRKMFEQIRLLVSKNTGRWDPIVLESIGKIVSFDGSSPYLTCVDDSMPEVNSKDSGIEEYVLNDVPLNKHKHAIEMLSESHFVDTLSNVSDISDVCHSEELRQSFFQMQLKLDEMMETVSAERMENKSLHRTIENLESGLIELKKKQEDMKFSENEAIRELIQPRDTHTNMVIHTKSDFIYESSFREDVERRLADVRAKVERLQVENALEWRERERLETEKHFMHRENKKLRSELRDALDSLEKRIKSQPSSDTELRTLLIKLAGKSMELNNLKHSHIKLEKSLNDKTTEVNQLGRRIEQYETEVKRLRHRIEELKNELACAENEAVIT